jgi:hypothetical protein
MAHVSWRVELLDHRVFKELDALASDVRQRFLRISQLIEQHGPAAMHEPYVKPRWRSAWGPANPPLLAWRAAAVRQASRR